MKTIHIFDMDDTLFETPKFSEFVGLEANGVIDEEKYFPDYFKKLKAMFIDKMNKNVSFEKRGDFILPINKETGKSFPGEFIDYFKDKKTQRYFDVHDDQLVIKSFPGFHSSPETLGKILNLDVIKDYQKANKKMIVTGRDEQLRSHIVNIFKELNLELPNYGLILYQKGSQSIKDFKTDIILKTIELNNWDEVHFYEDRADWLYHAEGAVKEKFPNVKFVPHLITNVKQKMKM
jgi:hypothetical protein